MTRARRRLPLLSLALVALGTAQPGTAPAAFPRVLCLVAFGSQAPAEWCDADLRDTLTPTSQPYGPAFERATLFVRGTATPGHRITVTATDGALSISTTVTALTDQAPSEGRSAGDFSAELKGYLLGVHSAPAGATPDSTDPDDHGKSIITVSATSSDPHTGAESTPVTTTITKFAATPGDVFEPTILKTVWPPAEWHGVYDLAQGCIVVLNACIPAAGTPTGSAYVKGDVEDRAPQGLSSEIAEISLTVTQGERVIRGPIDVLARTGSTKAGWRIAFRQKDFEPNNLPGQPKYRFTVTIVDAWGNRVDASSGDVTVYPF